MSGGGGGGDVSLTSLSERDFAFDFDFDFDFDFFLYEVGLKNWSSTLDSSLKKVFQGSLAFGVEASVSESLQRLLREAFFDSSSSGEL